ncbi:MAG TPA: aminotransferase class I/II-fold pyridoxal phosphate-dependent enzyme [Solirubrobacterales bacterium]
MSEAIDLTVPPLAQLERRRSEKWAGQEAGVLAMTVAEMDFPLAAPVAGAVRAALERDDLGYASAAGAASMAEALALFARRRLGWTVDPAQVRPLPDVVVGFVELCRALVPAGGTVALPVPAYPPFFSELPQAGLRIAELPLDATGEFELDDLRAALRGGARALILVNPQNPTGRVIPRARLEAIAELCAEHEAWAIADEIHAPLVLPGAAHTPWLEVSEAAREFGFSLFSASKAFNLAGLKAAQLVTASERARAAAARLPRLAEHAGLLGVLAAEAAFRDGGEWLDAVLLQLAGNRERLGAALTARVPEIRWTPPQGTYLAWLDCRELGLGEEDPAARFLRRGRLALSPGPAYGSAGAGFARLNFATSGELVEEAVRRIAASL